MRRSLTTCRIGAMNLGSRNLGAVSLALGLLLPTALLAQPGGAAIRVAASPCPPFVTSEDGELLWRIEWGLLGDFKVLRRGEPAEEAIQ